MTSFAPLEINCNKTLPRPAKVGLSLTGFAKKVYKVVLNIPLGEVCTYKWVAKKVGRPRAWRCVGQVLKHNPYPLIIPCHRVIESRGKAGGYIWGKKIKKKLLELERQIKELVV